METGGAGTGRGSGPEEGEAPAVAVAPSARSHARFWFGLGALALILVAAHALDARAILDGLLRRAHAAGGWGLALAGLLYVPTALLGLPCAPLTMAAGWAFGPVAAALMAVPSATVGACAAFLAGRLGAGDPRWEEEGEGRIARAARALEGRRGFWTVVLLRVSPVTPFAVLNFAFGATPMRLRAYALATLLGSIPTAIGFAVMGAILGPRP